MPAKGRCACRILAAVIFPVVLASARTCVADAGGASAPGERAKTHSRRAWSTVVIASEQFVKRDRTIPPNVSLRFEKGGTFNVGAGATLTINGSVEAPLQRIFCGDGRVILGTERIKEVYPQWWGARGDNATDDTAAIQAAIDSQPRGGVVFFPIGTHRISSAIRFHGGLRLISDGASLVGSVPVLLQSSNPTERCNGLRIRGLSLDGVAEGATGVGLDLTNVSYGTFQDFGVIHCAKGVVMDQICMYNIFTNLSVGACTTAIETNNSTNASRIFGGRIGKVATGVLVNVANDFQIYGLSIEVFDTGIDIRRGDTVHMYNLYLAGGGTGIKIAGERQVSECTVINPRYSQVATEIDDQAEDTLILDNNIPSKRLSTQALLATGISSTSVAARNLCGGVTISGTDARSVVRFPTPEPNDAYHVVATCVSTGGSPPTGAANVRIEGKSAVGFDLVLQEAPGAGNSVSVDWILVR